jgi:hypothetical protein
LIIKGKINLYKLTSIPSKPSIKIEAIRLSHLASFPGSILIENSIPLLSLIPTKDFRINVICG